MVDTDTFTVTIIIAVMAVKTRYLYGYSAKYRGHRSNAVSKSQSQWAKNKLPYEYNV